MSGSFFEIPSFPELVNRLGRKAIVCPSFLCEGDLKSLLLVLIQRTAGKTAAPELLGRALAMQLLDWIVSSERDLTVGELLTLAGMVNNKRFFAVFVPDHIPDREKVIGEIGLAFASFFGALAKTW